MSDETPETPEISDEEAAELVDLSELGVDGTPTEKNYFHNLEVYNKYLKVCTDFAEKSKSGTLTGDIKTEVTKTLEQVKPLDEVSTLEKQLLEIVYQLLESEPDQVMHILKSVSELKEYVQDTKQFLVDSKTEEIKRETGVTETPDEAAENAKHVCQAVRQIMRAQLQISKLTPKQFPVPAGFKYKVGANGDWTPDVTGLPKTRSGVSNTGRGARKRKVVYSWKATGSDEFVNLPVGILTGEIANRVISSGSYRVTNAMLMARFNKSNEGSVDQYSETPWELEFETGTLRGYLPK